MKQRLSNSGACLCGKPAFKFKHGGWCCQECDKIESRMKVELGALVGLGLRKKYSEMDFRGRVFGT